MRSNKEILRDIGDLPNENKPETEYLAYLNAMKEAQIEALDEFYNRLSDYDKFYAEHTLNQLKSELQ